MRVTPTLLGALGVLMLIYAYMNFAMGVPAEALDLSARNAACDAAERMTADELSRVFEISVDTRDAGATLESAFGRNYSRGLRSHFATIAVVSATVGLALCIWSIAEQRIRIARETAQPREPQPVPADLSDLTDHTPRI